MNISVSHYMNIFAGTVSTSIISFFFFFFILESNLLLVGLRHFDGQWYI